MPKKSLESQEIWVLVSANGAILWETFAPAALIAENEWDESMAEINKLSGKSPTTSRMGLGITTERVVISRYEP